MSLIQMQVAVEEHRANLEAAGIRGIDIDYLLDPRVDHRACLVAFEDVAAKELARWVEVRGMCTPEQWEWFEVMEEHDRLEVKTIKLATRRLREAFKLRVLKFHKEAVQKFAVERDKARAQKRLEKAQRKDEGEQVSTEAVKEELNP